MSQIELRQASSYRINYIALEISTGQTYDLRHVFEELNIFDNMLTPCMSGNIVLKDSVGIFNYLKFDGSEFLHIDIDKGENTSTKENNYNFGLRKKFRIYKVTSRSNVSMTSQMYVLHFVSPEFLLSERKKISSYYNPNSYSNMIKTILNNELQVPNDVATEKSSGINVIEETGGVHDIIIPTLTPFDAIQLLAKRATAKKSNSPEMVFFENKYGYNLISLSSMYVGDKNPDVINFKVKNVEDNIATEFYGAKSFKILTQNNLSTSIREGVYSGKFLAFDTLTKTRKEINLDFQKLFGSMSHLNNADKPIIPRPVNNEAIEKDYASRIVSYPWAFPRTQSKHIKENDSKTASVFDDTENYVFQRKSIFANLFQKRIELVMPGNFSLYSGKVVNLNMPKFTMYDASSGEGLDPTLEGKYIILCTRHIITYQKHETIIQVATDTYK